MTNKHPERAAEAPGDRLVTAMDVSTGRLIAVMDASTNRLIAKIDRAFERMAWASAAIAALGMTAFVVLNVL